MIWGQDYLLKQHKPQDRYSRIYYLLKPIHRNILKKIVKGIQSDPCLIYHVVPFFRAKLMEISVFVSSEND